MGFGRMKAVLDTRNILKVRRGLVSCGWTSCLEKAGKENLIKRKKSLGRREKAVFWMDLGIVLSPWASFYKQCGINGGFDKERNTIINFSSVQSLSRVRLFATP